MKWLSQYVARSYKFLIYIYASTLVLVGLSIAEDGSVCLFQRFFSLLYCYYFNNILELI